MTVTKEQWDNVWRSVKEVAGWYPDGIVFIGGVAVYVHVLQSKLTADWIEFSKDADLYIDMVDLSALRDFQAITRNDSLHKYQFILNGVDFDVYREYHHKLRISYDDMATWSAEVDGVRVACLEHLLFLKIDAFRSRRDTPKGPKDQRDLVRLCRMLSRRRLRKQIVDKYQQENDLSTLLGLKNSAAVRELSGTYPERKAINTDISKVTHQLYGEDA